MQKKILVVDDSAVIRRYLIKLFEEAGYSVEFAKNGEDALEKLSSRHFSLVTLDIEMPTLDGMETLKEIMKRKPTRVIMLSSYVKDSAGKTTEALEIGALDCIYKPKNSLEIAKISDEILSKVKSALLSVPHFLKQKREPFKVDSTSVKTDIEMKFVLIGSSTGGPRLIEKICRTLPKNYPHAVCVVQHMPTDFTANFAKRLNSISEIEVLEAENGVELKAGRVIIAKGGKHLHFRKKLKTFSITLVSNVRERFFVPSIDEMFLSASETLPCQNILAIELTGIGDDGADEMVELRRKGAQTIAESEKSAVVYGMPKEAFLRGGAKVVLDFNEILDEVIKYGK